MKWLFKLTVFYALVIIVALVTLYLTALPESPDASGFSRLVIAHRGDGLGFPENSLPAIRGAKSLNADAVEVDVMMTADGVLVALHDPTLERTTNGTGHVADYTFEEIRKLRLKNGENAQVPSLEQVIETVIELDLKLEIEMKTEISKKYEAALKVAQLFKRYNIEKRAFVSSFDPRFLYYLRDTNPGIVTALAFTKHPPYNKLLEFLIHRESFANYLGVGIIEPSKELADKPFIDKWQARGFAINIWTVNSAREKAFYEQFPVTITTDCPASLC